MIKLRHYLTQKLRDHIEWSNQVPWGEVFSNIFMGLGIIIFLLTVIGNGFSGGGGDVWP